MDHIVESQEYGKGDFVLLDDLTIDAFMANLKLRYRYFGLLQEAKVVFYIILSGDGKKVNMSKRVPAIIILCIDNSNFIILLVQVQQRENIHIHWGSGCFCESVQINEYLHSRIY